MLSTHSTTELYPQPPFFLFLNYLFFLALGFELKSSHSLHRHSTTWATLPAPISEFLTELNHMMYTYVIFKSLIVLCIFI
jgi:hypothetical protein